MPRTEQGRTVETTTEARAGRTGMGVRWVLTVSLVAVVAIFALLWLYHFA
jgi:hypothetical protein